MRITGLFLLSALNVCLHKLLGASISETSSHGHLKPHQVWCSISDRLCDLNVKKTFIFSFLNIYFHC